MARACDEQIISLVNSLNLAKGDRLPGERELASRLNASRNTIRESLVSLAARGQVEIKKRSGCYLISTTPKSPWSSLHTNTEAALEALRAIGPHLAERSAKVTAPKQMLRLETLTAQIGHHLVEQNAQKMASAYISFYVALGDIGGNPYLTLMLKEIAAACMGLMAEAVMDKAKTDSFFELHVSLLQSIRAHDLRRSQLLALHSLDAFATMLSPAPSATAKKGAA